MTLRPIPGAPVDAPIPDFPTGEPAPLALPESRSTSRPVDTQPTEAPQARRAGPVEIRGDDDCILTFRIIPEVPAINRSSMTISITGGARLDLAIDEARTFLRALRNGHAPLVIADGRAAFQLAFAIAEDGPSFTVGRPGEADTARRFSLGWGYDVEAMAANLLAELGP